MKKCIVFLGKTGAGKDTQADLLQAKYHIPVIRLGELVRKRAKTDQHVAEQLSAGELVDDPIVDDIMKEAISSLTGSSVFVSDGYPRHINQAHTLENLLQFVGADLALVLYFDISDSEVRLRLQLRGREDDTPDAILERLNEFHTSTELVVNYFRAHNKFEEIDASQTPESIFEQVEVLLKKEGIIK